jgi:diguanylate cyclase (GGDEF)-like protein
LEIEKKTGQMNANTDSLTGLANRRYFDEVLDKEVYRYKRSGSPLSLIMLDVDYFKKYNDTYGHLAGDNCLRLIGTTLKTVAGRIADSTARYGGEEFVALLPDTDLEGASALAERIRTAVETLAIPHSASSISKNVTVSLGVATMHTELLSSPEQFIGLADEAMYDAKKGGRNRVCLSTENVGV